MSTNIYNLKHSTRTGFVRLGASGKELFGTVVKHGLMNKTVTVSTSSILTILVKVRVSRYHFNRKINYWIHNGKNFQSHDEENFCKTGDKVVIR